MRRRGGVADDLAPLLDRNLTGDDRGRALMTVFEDLEDVALFRLGEDGKAPVVQDQELDASEGFEHAAVAAIAAASAKASNRRGARW